MSTSQKGGRASTVLGFRVGTKTYQAASMYLAKNGATTSQIKAKLGSAHLNLLTKVKTAGHSVTRVKALNKATGKQETRYRIVLKAVKK